MTPGQQFTLELLKEGRAYLTMILPVVTALLAPSPVQHLFTKKAEQKETKPNV